MREAFQKEVGVAFHKESQPVWLRIAKYAVILMLVFFFWKSMTFWWSLLALLIASLGLHFFYRHKTRVWTQSYGRGFLRWNHDKVMGSKQDVSGRS